MVKNYSQRQKFELNEGQKKALRIAMSGKNLFLSGFAGTEKSFALSVIRERLETSGRTVLVCASTGKAASLIGGVTVHRAFGLEARVCVNYKTLEVESGRKEMLKHVDVVIIDEISALRMDVIDAAYKCIQQASVEKGKPIQVIVVGDFAQLPPVIKESGKTSDGKEQAGDREILEAAYKRLVGKGYAFQADSWKNFRFEPCVLDEIIRQSDRVFIGNLNKARIGDTSCVPYFNHMYYDNVYDPDAVYLASKRLVVQRINDMKLKNLEGKLFTLKPVVDFWPDKRIDELPEAVSLKAGAKVIFTSNDRAGGYDLDNYGKYINCRWYNGASGTVKHIYISSENQDKDRIVVKMDDGGTFEVYRTEYNIYDNKLENGSVEQTLTGCALQFPLILGYALTIHKAQGMTLDKVTINPNCFECGQFYVAVSRCSKPENIHLEFPVEERWIKASPEVKDFYEQIMNTGVYVPTITKAEQMSFEDALDHDSESFVTEDVPVTKTFDSVESGAVSDDAEPIEVPVEKKIGRPRRGSDSVVMRVPIDFLDQVQLFIDTAFPQHKPADTVMIRNLTVGVDNVCEGIDLTKTKPVFDCGSKSKRVPVEIADSLKRLFTLSYGKGLPKRTETAESVLNKAVDSKSKKSGI